MRWVCVCGGGRDVKDKDVGVGGVGGCKCEEGGCQSAACVNKQSIGVALLTHAHLKKKTNRVKQITDCSALRRIVPRALPCAFADPVLVTRALVNIAFPPWCTVSIHCPHRIRLFLRTQIIFALLNWRFYLLRRFTDIAIKTAAT